MLKKLFFTIATSLLFFVGVFWAYLQTDHAKNNILHLIHQSVKEASGYDISVETISFPLPFKWTAKGIKIHESQELLLTVETMHFSFPFWELIWNTFALNRLKLENVHIFKTFLLKNQTSVASNLIAPSQAFDWDSFKYSVRLTNIHIKNLIIEPENLSSLPSYLFPLDLEGSFILNPSKRTAIVDLSAKKYDSTMQSQPVSRLNIAIQDSDSPTFHIHLLENPQALLSQICNFSVPYDVKVSIEGKISSANNYDGLFSVYFLKNNFYEITNKKLKGTFNFSDDGQLNIQSMEGEWGPVCLIGDLAFNSKDLKFQENAIKIQIQECEGAIQNKLIPLKGSLELISSVKGSLNNPIFDFKILGNQLTLHDEPLDQLVGKIVIYNSQEGLAGNSHISLNYNNLLLKSEGKVLWDKNQVSFSEFKANYGDISLNGDLHYSIANKIFQGTLAGDMKDSAFLKSLLKMDLSGSSQCNLAFYGAESTFGHWQQNIDFIFNVDRARYMALGIQKIQLSGFVENLFKNPIANLELNAEHALFQGWSIGKLKMQTEVDFKTNLWPFKIDAEDPMDHGIFGNLEGSWHVNSDIFQLNLDHLDGYFKKHHFKLNHPLDLTAKKDYLDLSPVSMGVDEGTFYTTIDYRADRAHATAQINQVPVEIFYPASFITPFTGFVTGEAFLFGQPGSLTGKLNAKISKVRIQDEAFAHVPPFEAILSGELHPKKMICSASIKGVTRNPIDIQAELPIRASLNPPEILVDEDAPLNGHLVVSEGEIAPLLQLLIIDTTSLSGKTSVILDVKGSFNNPNVTGKIAITNGTFESPNTGAIYRNLNARLEANDKVLFLKELSAIDLSDGIITGTGMLEIKREHRFPFTLNLELSRIRLLNLDFVKAIASGKITITGNTQRGRIDGQLITDSVRATIPDQAPSLAHSLNVRYINLPSGEVSPLSVNSRSKWPLELNLQIDVPDNASIKAKDLLTDWHGGVKVQGFAHAPQLFGDFKIIKGEYHFNGKTFDIKEGTISIAGEPDKKTSLYVIASKDLGKIVAEVILKGSAKNPAISFRSNPPMSQRDILSWILFGRSSSEITPFQGTELSQSIQNLAKGKNKNPDMLSKLRDSIGIDRIDISKTDGNESNEVSIQVGKYISRGVFVSVNKSITAEANQIGIEANLLNNIKAEAQIGDDSSAKLQLKWKQDY